MLSFLKKSRLPSESVEGLMDIDVTPVMNMFVVLILFLITVATFTQVALIEFNLPPNVGGDLAGTGGSPKLKITVVVAAEYLGITYGENMIDSIPNVKGNYNLDSLYKSLVMNQQKYNIRNEIIVAVRDAIKIKNVVNVMDLCGKAGFEKVGLSSATENPESL